MLNEDELKQTQRALDYFLANFDLTTSEKRAANRAYEKLDRFIDGDVIASCWEIDDVISLMPDGDDVDGRVNREHTPQEVEWAREVLRRADRYHDATIGINWSVLEYVLSDVLREARGNGR